jgi:hypothetical protein
LKVKGKAKESDTEGTESTEKKGKSTGLKTGHYKEEPYD